MEGNCWQHFLPAYYYRDRLKLCSKLHAAGRIDEQQQEETLPNLELLTLAGLCTLAILWPSFLLLFLPPLIARHLLSGLGGREAAVHSAAL